MGLPAEAVVTCVIDRGIFSHEVFAHAIGTPDDHLITGEKNHRRGHWDLRKRSGHNACWNEPATTHYSLNTKSDTAI